jgi:hypothetical protein
MLHEMLRFLYIAFRQYWATWVTGTGIAGFTLWAINYLSDRVRSKPMSLRTNLMILFCFFWFIATFSAWHDAEKNLSLVEKQRADDNSNWNQCKSDLRVQQFSAELWKQQFASQQTMTSSFQDSLNRNQGAMNVCVVTLAKRAQIVPEKITLRAALIVWDQTVRIAALLLETNSRRSQVKGTLTCDNDFSITQAEPLGRTSKMSNLHMANARTAEIDVQQVNWDSDHPVILGVVAKPDFNQNACRFTLHE